MLLRFFYFFLFLCFSHATFASSQVTKARAWQSPDKTRVVFEITKEAKYKVFQLHKPERLVIDLVNTRIEAGTLKSLDNNSSIVASRSSKKGKNNLRVVLELKKKSHFKAFQLKPGQGYQHRLVIDISPPSKISSLSKIASSNSLPIPAPSKASVKKTAAKTIAPVKKTKVTKSVSHLRNRDLIVAIDAGHGGEDPGATGRRGTKEKKIVLSIAKKLAKKVNRQAGMKALLIRTGDYYISLRGRTRKARRANADVFVSIHADAFRNSKARGSSVFILSKRGASSETARWLANKENSADLAGGVSLDDKEDLLAKVLLDLSQTASIEGSNSVARKVLNGLKKIGKVHKKSVERAGFVVLKAPDMPSILVETGFISNPYEENQLRRSSYQKKIADAIFNGIDAYFRRYPIPGTIYGQKLIAKTSATKNFAKSSTKKSVRKTYNKRKSLSSKRTRHKVVRGDSLSKLAHKYRVSIKEIKRANSLRSSTLFLGKILTIPH